MRQHFERSMLVNWIGEPIALGSENCSSHRKRVNLTYPDIGIYESIKYAMNILIDPTPGKSQQDQF